MAVVPALLDACAHLSALSLTATQECPRVLCLLSQLLLSFHETALQKDAFDFLFVIIHLFSLQLFCSMLLKIDMVQATLRGTAL